MRKKFLVYSLLPFVIVLHALTEGFSGQSSAGAVLLKSPSAMAQSMAEAFVSMPADVGGVASLRYNPASTAFLKNPEMSLMGRNGIADDTFGAMVFGRPTGWGSLSGSLSYYTMGSIDLADPQGRTRSVRAEEDVAANLNYGKKIGKRLGLGFNLKALHSKLVDAFSSNAFAADVGAQLHRNRFSFGLAILNLGTPLKYANSAEPLPAAIEAGVSYKLSWNHSDVPQRLLLSFDVIKEMEETLKKFSGLEYLWNDTIAFRLGSKFGHDSEQLVMGAGFTVGRFQFDYDHFNLDEANGVHTVSATYKFAGNPAPPKP